MKAKHLQSAGLAWQHLRFHRFRTLLIVLSLGTLLFLPAFSYSLGKHIDQRLMARATQTPLVLGASGNNFDLLISSLYFQGDLGQQITWEDVQSLEAMAPGNIAPIHHKYQASGAPIIGTNLAHFEHRKLTIASGRMPATLGEVVAGHRVAAALDLQPGSQLRSQVSGISTLDGAYPMSLSVVGILNPSNNADDHAFFTDIKTTWLLDGLYHGHAEEGSKDVREDSESQGGQFLFQGVTSENLPSFHIHGEPQDWPISSVLLFPKSAKEHDLLLANYDQHPNLVILRPPKRMHELLDMLLNLQQLLGVAFVMISIATSGLVILIFNLSLQLRRREFEVLKRLGAARSSIAQMIAYEWALVAIFSVLLAITLSNLSQRLLSYYLHI